LDMNLNTAILTCLLIQHKFIKSFEFLFQFVQSSSGG